MTFLFFLYELCESFFFCHFSSFAQFRLDYRFYQPKFNLNACPTFISPSSDGADVLETSNEWLKIIQQNIKASNIEHALHYRLHKSILWFKSLRI